ncbi:hypothetical protein GH733_017780 [Mirounga leonina]|nr:hypothetical protein GH733_017780 [Mirounga leonina]
MGAELESQSQSRREQDAPLEQWPDPLEDTPAPGARIPDESRAIAQLRSLVAALDKTAKGLGVDTLKERATEIRGYVPPAGEKNPAVPSAILSGSDLPIPGPPCLRLTFTSWLSLSQPIQPPTRTGAPRRLGGPHACTRPLLSLCISVAPLPVSRTETGMGYRKGQGVSLRGHGW